MGVKTSIEKLEKRTRENFPVRVKVKSILSFQPWAK